MGAQPMNVVDQLGARTGPRRGALYAVGAAGRSAALAGRCALAAAVVMGLVLAVDSAAHPSFLVANSVHWPGWLAGPLSLLPGSALTPGTYSELTYGMCAAYLVALACSRSIGVRPVIAAAAFLQLVFVLAPPLASGDIWNYVGYGHLGALHGVSPYAHVALHASQDPAYRWITWPTPTPYGPLFTILTYAAAPLGVAGGVWTIKVVMGLAAGGCLWLVWRCARRLAIDPVPALLLVGLSPVWLIWMVGGAHNDVLMLLVVLVGVALWLSGHQSWAGFAIVIAAGLKMPALLLLPFAVIAVRDRGGALRILAGAAVGALTVALASLVAFGSLGPALAFGSQARFHTTRSLLGQFLRLFNARDSLSAARVPATVIVVVAVAALVIWAWRSRAGALAMAGWATAALLLGLVWEFPWYVTWLLPLAALARDRRLALLAVAMSLALLLAYVPPYMSLT